MAEECTIQPRSPRRWRLGIGVAVLLGACLLIARLENAPPSAQRLTLNFQGPFQFNQQLPLEDGSGWPVQLNSVGFDDPDIGNHVAIDFFFQGPKDRRRTLDVTVTARDPSGKVLVQEQVRCHDARDPDLSQTGHGTEPDTPFLNNYVLVALDQVTPQQIAQLEITFTP